MTQPRRAPRILAALLLTGIAVAACTGGSGASPILTASPTTAPAASATAATGGVTVNVAENAAGTIVVDADGMALYLFTRDTQGSGTSACNGDCAASWPPLLLDSGATAEPGDGLTGTLGTATRNDGSVQVTLDGWPLYHYAGDTAPGDTNGQGLNDVWWLVAPDGSAVGTGSAGPDGY